MKWRAANNVRAGGTNAAARTIRSLVRHADEGHFPLISNRHLPIRNEAISLKTQVDNFSNRHVCGRPTLPDRRSFFGPFSAQSAACLSRATIEGAAHDD
jgi:hypothetical protein